jgi:hypothetical protein
MAVGSNSLTSEEHLLGPVTLMYFYNNVFVQASSTFERI